MKLSQTKATLSIFFNYIIFLGLPCVDHIGKVLIHNQKNAASARKKRQSLTVTTAAGSGCGAATSLPPVQHRSGKRQRGLRRRISGDGRSRTALDTPKMISKRAAQ